MNRAGKRLGLAVAIVAVVVLLMCLGVKSRREPVVRGVPLSEWLENWKKDSAEYEAAVAEMDERCVRWLIDELQWSPTSFQTKLDGFMFHVMRQPVAPERRPDYRAAAAFTLSKLGSRAQPAVPALRFNTSVSGSSDWEAQSMAIAALILLGADSLDTWADKLLSPTNASFQAYVLAAGVLQTNAASAVPRLVHAYATADDGIKWRITMALRLICSNSALSVPVLRASLTNDYDQMKVTAMFGLLRFGSESRPAWDDLVPLLSDTNRTVRGIATNTLRRIDREAAQQLGIK